MTCGILHGEYPGAPTDLTGCCLPVSHPGPHEFTATDGHAYQWRTDLECDCDHCMQGDGDYCTIYWQKGADSGAANTNKGGEA